MNQEKIGLYIQSKRKKLNLTQKEFSEKLGVSDKTVSKWERGINLPDMSLYDDVCKILNISLVEFLKGEDVEDDKKIIEVEKELKKSFVNNSKLEKVIGYFGYFLIYLSILVFMFITITRGPFKFFYNIYNICYITSFTGFVIIMYKSNKTLLNKIIKTFIFIISMFVFCIVILILKFLIFVNPNSLYYDNSFFVETLPEECNGLTDDEIIESGNFNNIDTDFVFVTYDIGLPFIKNFFKLYDDKDKLVDIFYLNDDNEYVAYDEPLGYKTTKIIKEKYNRSTKTFISTYTLYSINYYIDIFGYQIFETSNYYVVYRSGYTFKYVNKYPKEEFKDTNILFEFLKLYPSRYKGDLITVIDHDNHRMVYDKNYNLLVS